MKNNTSSFICSLIFLAVVGFVMSPTSTKHRVLKSAETLFNLKEGSLLRAFNSVESNSENGTSESKGYHSSDAKEYFKEICLESESGKLKKTVVVGSAVMSPLHTTGNTIYIHSRDDYVSAFDTQSGELTWKFKRVTKKE